MTGQGLTAELVELLTPNPLALRLSVTFLPGEGLRLQLQHMNEAAYQDWKNGSLERA